MDEPKVPDPAEEAAKKPHEKDVVKPTEPPAPSSPKTVTGGWGSNPRPNRGRVGFGNP